MQISAIRPYNRPNVGMRPIPKNRPAGIKDTVIKNSLPVNFTGGKNLLFDYLNDTTLAMHQLEAQRLDLDLLNKLFNEQFHIPFDLSGVSEAAAKVIGYCCFHTAMIFRQIKQPLPTMIGIEKVAQESGEGITIARCFWGNRTFPIRAVTFNSLYDWENAIVNAKSTSNENGYHSSYHFLQTTIHEFAHNAHFHHLYSKFGSPDPAPGYTYNPKVYDIMSKLNFPIYDKDGNITNNQFISTSVRNTMKESSGYGSTLLPELFAEEFSRAVIKNLDPVHLTLKRNPFPITTTNKDFNSVLYETWEGLIDDGQGLI